MNFLILFFYYFMWIGHHCHMSYRVYFKLIVVAVFNLILLISFKLFPSFIWMIFIDSILSVHVVNIVNFSVILRFHFVIVSVLLFNLFIVILIPSNYHSSIQLSIQCLLVLKQDLKNFCLQ